MKFEFIDKDDTIILTIATITFYHVAVYYVAGIASNGDLKPAVSHMSSSLPTIQK